jgi:DNA-directed RNA polymerase subunit RPC12/RpoP
VNKNDRARSRKGVYLVSPILTFRPSHGERDRIKYGFVTIDYRCGYCGSDVSGRMLAESEDKNGRAWWYQCPSCGAPTGIFYAHDSKGEVVKQWPEPLEFYPSEDWPEGLRNLFLEASMSYAVGAHTSCAMACRRLLMVAACENGAEHKRGKKFVEYVDDICDKILRYEPAKQSILEIKDIGNAANHELETISESDAAGMLKKLEYLLNTLYALGATDRDE